MSLTTSKQRNPRARRTTIIVSDDGTARARLLLSETSIGQILDALADHRDPFGDEASPLEDRLRDHLANLRAWKAGA